MADRSPNLPGLTPAFSGGRTRGPWRQPARVPCDYKRANGLICELESVASWCRNQPVPASCTETVGAWHRHEPGVACAVNQPILNRCALHPPVMGR